VVCFAPPHAAKTATEPRRRRSQRASPTTIINAKIDALRSDGGMLADKMKSAGNGVAHKVYLGVTHEFFGMDAVVAKAKEAQDFAVAQLQKGFGSPPGTVGTAPSK
jgi:acetyl esterase